jgi:hypothetical protein
MVYTGPEAAVYPPHITAVVSQLTGNVDAQNIIGLPTGGANNLSGFSQIGHGGLVTFGGYPAYTLGGTAVDGSGQTVVVAQTTVVIPSQNGLYVLELDAYCLPNQVDTIDAAFQAFDAQTTITA